VITWNSSNTGVATINSSGVATGASPGTTTITASSEGQTSNGATLTVTAVPVASVTVAPTSQSVLVGSNAPAFSATTKDGGGNTLTGRVVTWSSSDITIATIDPSTGVATGVAPGTVTITATSESQTGTASLTVNPVPVASVDIAPGPISGTSAGGTIQFTATPRDASSNALTGRVITWTSSDTSTATVDSNGLMTAITDGLVTITAHCEGIDSNGTVVTILL